MTATTTDTELMPDTDLVSYIAPVRTVRYRTEYRNTGYSDPKVKVTWRDFDGTRRQKAVKADVLARLSDVHATAVAEVAGVPLTRVVHTDDYNVYTVDF